MKTSFRNCALAAFSAALLAAPPSRAAEILEPGDRVVVDRDIVGRVVITRADGTITTLADEVALVTRSEFAAWVLDVRDLERCRAALDECGDDQVDPPAGGPGWHVWAALGVAVFAAGAAAGAVAASR